MVYEDYENFKNQYHKTQLQYNDILSKKENLFAMTQPHTTDYGKVLVDGGTPKNSFDAYLIKKEEQQIDEKLAEIKSILEDREQLLKLKEQELRASNDIQDKIYRYRVLDKMRVYKISRLIGYSERQIYRILDEMGKMS